MLEVKRKKTFISTEPDSSSTVSSLTLSKNEFGKKNASLFLQKRANFKSKCSISSFISTQKEKPLSNLGFGSFGPEFDENYEILAVLGKVSFSKMTFINYFK